MAILTLAIAGCTSLPRDLWEEYRGKTLYARYNVPLTSAGIVDTRVGAISGDFIPLGGAVAVREVTGEHLSLGWEGRILFLLYRGEEEIERVFGLHPPGNASDAVRDRRVQAGMTPEETSLSWGPPPRIKEGPRTGEEIWLYPGKGSWRARVTFRDDRVVQVDWEEGDAPLVPDPYPTLEPREKRPYQGW